MVDSDVRKKNKKQGKQVIKAEDLDKDSDLSIEEKMDDLTTIQIISDFVTVDDRVSSHINNPDLV